jgi:hypothetical protein
LTFEFSNFQIPFTLSSDRCPTRGTSPSMPLAWGLVGGGSKVGGNRKGKDMVDNMFQGRRPPTKTHIIYCIVLICHCSALSVPHLSCLFHINLTTLLLVCW